MEEHETNNTHIEQADTNDTPIEGHETNDTPIEEHETNDTPIEQAETNDTPIEGHETNDTPIEEHETNDTPIEQAETNDTPIEEHETNDTPIEEVESNDTPIEELGSNDTPIEQPGSNDTPIEEPESNDTKVDKSETYYKSVKKPEPILIDKPVSEPMYIATPVNEASAIEGQSKKKTKRKTKLARTYKQPKLESDLSSSDDNLTLNVLKEKNKKKSYINFCSDVESVYESGESYKPSKDDYNSSDSNLSIQSSDDSIKIHISKPCIPKTKKKKRKYTNKKKLLTDNACPNYENSCRSQSDIQNIIINSSITQTEDKEIARAKEISVQEATFNKYVTTHNEKKLDDLLFLNGLVRKEVCADGNCFFHSALPHIKTPGTAQELRTTLCNHIVENAESYVNVFAANSTGMSESFEEDMTWIDFRQEIEALSVDGTWTSKAADLLPLALANWTGRLVKIFSSLSYQPIIEVKPTMEHKPYTDPIYLAYIASDNTTIPEHYDMCYKLGAINPNEQTPGNSQNILENVPFPNSVDKTASTPVKEIKKRGRPKGTPPKKAPNFITPPKKSLFRKRKATPETWKKNVRKRLRLAGKEYKSAKGDVVQERVLKDLDCSKCTFKCRMNINDKSRNDIFKTFWSLDSTDRKKDFVVANTSEKKTRTYMDEDNTPVRKKKNVHRKYSFCVDGVRHHVCKKYFLATLGVSESYVHNALKNQQSGVYIGTDKRGKHEPSNKTSRNALEVVRKHIESFPVVDGHYTRKDSNRKYLGADLNITRMYHLYIEQCKGVIPEKDIVSQSVYRKVFNEEYNFSFHVPKKDQCGLCISYHQAVTEGTLTPALKEDYEKHQERKIRAREEKKKDKDLAKCSNEISVSTFDLQAVLTTPCSLVSQLYYMRKLNCYNLSIYNLGSNNATCYIWSDVDAQRGSCEIGTCLYLQLLSLPQRIKHAIFYSDACSGQNRNQFIATCLLHFVTHHSSIKVIDHKFLESGHTQMECDSMHAAIEFAKKKTEIFVPQQWATVIRMARRKDPYNIVPLKFGDIYDFKEYSKKYMKFRKEDVNGGKVNWLQIKWIRYTQEKPDSIMFKYNFEDEFRVLKLAGTVKLGRNVEPQELTKNTRVDSKYQQRKRRTLSVCAKVV